TIAGSGAGYLDGPGPQARFGNVNALAIAPSGKIIVADQHNNAIRSIDLDAGVTTLVGNGICGTVDGTPDAGARVCSPKGVAVASDGTIYFTETATLRKIQNGVTTTIAGSTTGYVDGTAAQARFNLLR